MSDVAWHEMVRMEASVRARMQKMDAADERVLRLIDLLPLPAGLLVLGERLAETEDELRSARREMYATSLRRGRELEEAGCALQFSAAGLVKIQKLLGYDNEPECLLAVVDLRMVADRVNKIESMASA